MLYSTLKTMFINCENNKQLVNELLNSRIKLFQYILDTKSVYNFELNWFYEHDEAPENKKLTIKYINEYNIELTDLIQYYNEKYNDNLKTDLTVL